MGVEDIDRGWKDIMKDFKVLDAAYSKVGVQQGTLRRGSGKEGSSDMVKLAAVHEFGTKKAGRNRNVVIPSRPAHRQAFDKNQWEIISFSRDIVRAIIDQKMKPKMGLGLIGEKMTNLIKKRITDLHSPRNTIETVIKKGSTNPLIDTGQLRASITHVEVGV